MLIYNDKKEFVGIDEADLNTLGFSTLLELQEESDDFADMFVKSPGFVHNFKHVNWIDFVTCADSTESTKVMIHAKSKNFRCLLDIKTAYLTEDASSKAFLVYLTNIREVSDTQNTDIPDEVENTTANQALDYMPAKEEAYAELIEELTITKEDLPAIDLALPIELDFEEEVFEEETLEEALEIDLSQDLQVPQQKEELQTTHEVFENGYVFDPQVASDELGLPVDLIEEFIEDFIAQAKEFKNELYQAFNDGDSDKLKILSHKLKGVAANLRIEDALESLGIINTSDDNKEIKTSLDTLYQIISKLSGEKVQVTKKVVVEQTAPEIIPVKQSLVEDDLDELDIFSVPKEDIKPKPIEDIEVPLSIDLPQLADDTFQSEDDIFKDTEPISLESDTLLELDFEDTIEEVQEIPVPIKEIVAPARTIHYDMKYVASEVGLSQEHFLELFEDYLSEAEGLALSMSQASKDNQAAIWKSKAMQLKGMSDNMRIKEFTPDLETLIQTQDSQIAQDSSSNIIESLSILSKIKG